jgi:hypothetical protein
MAPSTPAVRFDDLGRFYGQTIGVTPLLDSGGVGTNQERASAPPHGGAIIDLNISVTAPPSPTLATTDPNPNGSRLRSLPPNPNPNESPPHLSLLRNQIIHWVI